MRTNISKYSADYLRTSYNFSDGDKLKASHARELVAAIFGYKSHAALMAEKTFQIDYLHEANIFIPDIVLLERRRQCLKNLPTGLPSSLELASTLSLNLQEERYLHGNVWLCESIGDYVMEELLIENDSFIMDELSDIMAGTNAIFDDAYYDSATVSDEDDSLVITVGGTYSGTSHDDKPFCGDQINMKIVVTLYRTAGRRGFQDFDIYVEGALKDWGEPEIEYEKAPNVKHKIQRPKDQFIEETGGFIFGETPEQFHQRQKNILAIREKIQDGNGTLQDVDVLSNLLGSDDDLF